VGISPLTRSLVKGGKMAKVICPDVCPDTVCTYKNCKKESFFLVADSDQDMEHGNYKYRCENHKNK
jgi:hypothetical protein